MSETHSPSSAGNGAAPAFAVDATPAPPVTAFPFKCALSLAPLIAFWHRDVPGKHPPLEILSQKLREDLQRAPELLGVIDDLSILERYQELLELMMSAVIPLASRDRQYSAACAPFNFQIFFATAAMQRLLMNEPLASRLSLDAATLMWGKLLRAYIHILKKFYGIDFDFDYPLIFSVPDSETKLDRHFRMYIDTRFIEIKNLSRVKPLKDDDKKRLMANLTDLKLLMELIPPDNFEFQGFTVVHAVEVTDQEVLSSLKRDLIEKESIISDAKFNFLQNKLRVFLRKPNLILGLAAIDGDRIFPLNYGLKTDAHCNGMPLTDLRISNFTGSVYERAVLEGGVVVDDLTTYTRRTSVEDDILKHGVRNVAVMPLYYQNKLIGTLELGSPSPGDINGLTAKRLVEVTPLFSMAIRRNLDEMNTQVQAIIKEKCTAIHPSVEWRFRYAAYNLLAKQQQGVTAEMEDIVFEEIYPLYGLSDIRSSSIQRNEAIKMDLLEHLSLVKEIIGLARRAKPMPFLEELAYRLDLRTASIEDGMHSGDEAGLVDFMKREVEPYFQSLEALGGEVGDKIQEYKKAVDPHLGLIYRRRKDFEDSVTRISEAISCHLDKEQALAQSMFPHYFEKHKSDGVDHGMYVGAALVEDGKFDMMYLKNLRLWQLIVMCDIARKTEKLKSRLQVPLETTHLILVQNTPLSIRFRFDEKQFDVDGAYNIRYEIMKKRIDKAVIKGRAERLTQPGKIAIVYSQDREAAEYKRYLDFLLHAGHLTGEREELELEDLQGIQGLRALRVTVNMQRESPQRTIAPQETTEMAEMVT